ncbi:hypothetical protein JHK86_024535 [Glycine max]|nr:hypothetical protein JHK86_024535 [Glycine max]
MHAIRSTPNLYVKAISIIGKTLAPFDDDNLIPCFGFGDAEGIIAFCLKDQHLSSSRVTRSVETGDGELSPQEDKTIKAIGLARSLGAAVIYNQDKPWDDHAFFGVSPSFLRGSSLLLLEDMEPIEILKGFSTKNWDHQMLRFQLIERATYSTNYREEIQKFKGLRLVIQISATGRLSIFNFYPIDGIGNYHAWNLNSGSVPSANSRLSPLPPELFNHQATIDIPLHNAKTVVVIATVVTVAVYSSCAWCMVLACMVHWCGVSSLLVNGAGHCVVEDVDSADDSPIDINKYEVVIEGERRDGCSGQYDQIRNARLPRALDPHSVPSEEFSTSLGVLALGYGNEILIGMQVLPRGGILAEIIFAWFIRVQNQI